MKNIKHFLFILLSLSLTPAVAKTKPYNKYTTSGNATPTANTNTNNNADAQLGNECEEVTPYRFGPVNSFDASKSDTQITVPLNLAKTSTYLTASVQSINVPLCKGLAAGDLTNLVRKSDMATTNCSATEERGEAILKRNEVFNANQEQGSTTLDHSKYTTSFKVCKYGSAEPCVAGVKLKSNSSDTSIPDVEADFKTQAASSYTKKTSEPRATTTR